MPSIRIVIWKRENTNIAFAHFFSGLRRYPDTLIANHQTLKTAFEIAMTGLNGQNNALDSNSATK